MPRLGLKGIFRCRCSRTSRSSAAAASAAARSATPTRSTARARRSTPTPSGAALSDDWKAELEAHYDEAERMLGVVTVRPWTIRPTSCCTSSASTSASRSPTRKTRVGVFFGEPGVTVDDPFFGGEGPDRTGCSASGAAWSAVRSAPRTRSTRTTSGSPSGAGREIEPERDRRRRPAARAVERRQRRLRGRPRALRRVGATRTARRCSARGVVVAAGALGTNRLLQMCKRNGSLPRSPTGSANWCAPTARRSSP